MRAELRRLTCTVTCAAAFFAPSQLWGQDASSAAPPVDDPAWQSMSAAEFATAAKVIAAGDRAVLAEMAWDRFLGNEQFLRESNLSIVLQLTSEFGSTLPVEGGADLKAALERLLQRRFTEDQQSTAGVSLYTLGGTVKALNGGASTSPATAPLVAAWMQANDWRSYEIQDLFNLFGFVYADAVNRDNFSARWTGTIAAPRSASYVFRQRRVVEGPESRIQLWIDGKLVLDSGDSAKEDPFVSEPVSLEAEKPVSIRVEFSHENAVERTFAWPGAAYRYAAPLAVVTWQPAGRPDELIPTSALAPPAESAVASRTGLRAEYFQDSAFEKVLTDRVDASLDLAWTWPPVVSLEAQATHEVLEELIARLLDPAFLLQTAGGNAVGKQIVFDYTLWRVAHRMTATQRLQLVELLLADREILRELSPGAVGRLFEAIYMLPGTTPIDLLGEWSLSRPQPRTEAGRLPGWGDGTYDERNIGFYWQIGNMLRGPYAELADRLAEGYLIRPGGECNLGIAYALAFAARESGTGDEFLARLSERLDDAQLSGNQLATWYFARAYAREVMCGRPEPLAGYDDLQAATLHAEDPETSFWALQELAARMSSLGMVEQTKALVEQHRDSLGSAERQAAADNWIATAESLATAAEARRSQEAAAAQAGYRAELERRRELAGQRGDEAATAALDAILQASPGAN